MARIEKKIKENRELFDIYEPSQDHFERFSKKLVRFNNPPKTIWNRGMVFKIAAVFLVLIIASFLVTRFYIVKKQDLYAGVSAPLPPEIKEAENYYTRINNEKLDRIGQLAGSDTAATRIREMARDQMEDINASTSELQKEYASGVRNPRVLDAIVNNYRIMTDLLDHIINDLNQEKTQNTNHNENNANQEI